LVKNYSQFISFPIYTWQQKIRPKDGKRKTTQKYWDWELANETKPIWLRDDVTTEEYNTFYKKTFNDSVNPQTYAHSSTKGEIEFKSLLFIPSMTPFNTEDMLGAKTKNIWLYVKRVFISDEFDGELVMLKSNFHFSRMCLSEL
jgi:heat shock protein beta